MKKTRSKPHKKLPQIVSVDTLHAILDHPPETIYEIRDLAICELFYSSGLRLSELVNLNYNDVNIKTNEIRVIDGKGGKHRVVPLGSCAKKALILWNNVRANMNNNIDDQAVFISRYGKRLQQQQIRNRIKALGHKISKKINLHPHKLRHSMASHVLESSGDIRAVQELLGHADISTTEIYTHIDYGSLFKAFDQYHPRAKSKKSKDQ